MGSFKLTAAANNQRASPYNNEQQKHLNIGAIRNGIIDSAFVEMVDASRPAGMRRSADDVNNRRNGKDEDMYRQRFVSVSSQSTLLTTISKADGIGVITTKSGDCGMNNNIDGIDRTKKSPLNANRSKFTVGPPEELSASHERIAKQPTALPPTSTLGTIAEKLKRKVLLFKSTPSAGNSSTHASNGNADSTSCGGDGGGVGIIMGGRNRAGRKLEKGSSVDSAHTNTISNSSLQEVDDDEFDSTELAKYMGQINNEIR